MCAAERRDFLTFFIPVSLSLALFRRRRRRRCCSATFIRHSFRAFLFLLRQRNSIVCLFVVHFLFRSLADVARSSLQSRPICVHFAVAFLRDVADARLRFSEHLYILDVITLMFS